MVKILFFLALILAGLSVGETLGEAANMSYYWGSYWPYAFVLGLIGFDICFIAWFLSPRIGDPNGCRQSGLARNR
jgi:hypothetical protein